MGKKIKYMKSEEMEEKKGMNIACTKWIIKEKEEEEEGRKTWKVRLVGKGFTENFGNKYECEAPICSFEGLKIVLAMTKNFGWKVKMVDIKRAHLQGDEMTREVYLRLPKEARFNQIWHIRKTVYGLKDATRHWYESLIEMLKKI